MSVSFHAVDLQRFVNYFSLKIWTYSVLSAINFDFCQKREKRAPISCKNGHLGLR